MSFCNSQAQRPAPNRREVIVGATSLVDLAGAALLGPSSALASQPKTGGTLRVGLCHGSISDSLDPATWKNYFMQAAGFVRCNCLTEIAPDGTSDHRGLLGGHGLLRKARPRIVPYLNVPMIIAGPGISRSERTALTSHVDVKATLLDLIGIENGSTDGTSFAGLLRGDSDTTNDVIFAEYHPRVVADQYNQSVISKDWRLTVYPRRPDWRELFDRTTDPGEHTNLFADRRYSAPRYMLADLIANLWPSAAPAPGKILAVY